MAPEDVPPGRPVEGEPMMALEGAPPGSPLRGDPVMTLAGAPPGSPFRGDPIVEMEGAPAGRPVAGDPLMALGGTPAGGCALTGPPGKALVWAKSPVAGAAINTMAASRIKPNCAGHDLALENGFGLFIE